MVEKLLDWIKEHLGGAGVMWALLVTLVQVCLTAAAIFVPMTATDAERILSTVRFQIGATAVACAMLTVNAVAFAGWRAWGEAVAEKKASEAVSDSKTIRNNTRKAVAIGDEYQALAANLRGKLNDPKNAKSRTLAPIRSLLATHDKNVKRIKDQDE